MPVTTRIITADKGSTRSVKLAVKSPDVIQVNTWFAIARDSGSSPTSRTTAASETPNDPSIAPHATAPDAALPRRRPALAFTRKPRNGSSGISSSIGQNATTKARKHEEKHEEDHSFSCVLRDFVFSWSRYGSPSQRRPGIGVQRFAMTEESDDD